MSNFLKFIPGKDFYDIAEVSHDETKDAILSEIHEVYPLLRGGRAFTDIQEYNEIKTFTDPTQMPDKNYVDTHIIDGGSFV